MISALEAHKMGFFVFFAPTPKNHEKPHFVASRAQKNRLDESSNSAHRDMHAKLQLIWTVSLVRPMGAICIHIPNDPTDLAREHSIRVYLVSRRKTFESRSPTKLQF